MLRERAADVLDLPLECHPIELIKGQGDKQLDPCLQLPIASQDACRALFIGTD